MNHKPQSELWLYAQTFAENHPWQGRHNNTSKVVFLALSQCAKNANENGIFRASIREISVLSRTSLNAVKDALKRFKAARLISHTGRDKTSTAFLWKFSDVVLEEGKSKTDTFPPTHQWTSWSESDFLATDAAERGALGYGGLVIYQTLLNLGQPMMPSAIAEHMNIPVYRVSYALKKLAHYGLAHREQKGWIAIHATIEELDERVARPAGKLGRKAARREGYAKERAIYVGHIILNARLENFYEEFLAQPRELDWELQPQSVDTLVSTRDAPSVKLWQCPNCGQEHFADAPPDKCDFCQDMTTWQLLGEIKDGKLERKPRPRGESPP